MAQYNLAQIRGELQRRLGGDIPEDRRDAVLEEAALDIIAHYHQEVAQRRIDKFLFSSDRYYALPDDALDLVPSLIRTALSFFTDCALSALPEAVDLLLRYEKLKVEINGNEVLLLRELKKAKELDEGGLSPAELSERVSEAKTMPLAQTNEVLTGLLAKSEAAGPEVTLVTRGENDRWRIGNI
jgi:hypothetical protein